MKNLHNIQEMKQFSIALQKFLKEKNIDIKHSLMLEGFAKAMDLPDWNTLSAVLQKPSSPDHNIVDYSKFSRDSEKIIRTANQTYYFQFDNELNIMLVGSKSKNNSFSLYLKISDHTIFENLSIILNNYIISQFNPSITSSHLSIRSFDGTKIIDSHDELVHSEKPNIDPFNGVHILQCDNGKIVVNTIDNTINFESATHQLIINNLNQISFSKQLLQFFNDLSDIKMNTPRFIYPLDDSLLSNMAMRYDHSFGLWAQDEPERVEVFLQKLRNLHSLYAKNLSNEEIVKLSGIDSISVQQLREEVEGDGFYNPFANEEFSKHPQKMFK